MANSTQDPSKLNRQGDLYGVTITGTVLAVLVVAARLIVRRHLKFKYGIDDVLIVMSLGALIAFTVGHIVAIKVGYGRPDQYVTNWHVWVSVTVSNIVAYAVGTTLTKISILCFYHRIFHSRGLKRISWPLSIFVILYNIALILVAALECIPLSTMWTGKPGTCIDTSPPFLTLGVINFVTDIVVVCLPIPLVLRLQMDMFRRLQVLAVFMTGAVVCAFGIVRVATLAELKPGDPSYNMAKPGVWSFAEQAIGIVGACLPTMGGWLNKKRMSDLTTSMRNLLSFTSSKARSTMNDSTANSASPYNSAHRASMSHQPGGRDPYDIPTDTQMDRMSGETMHSSEDLRREMTNKSKEGDLEIPI